MGTQNQITDLEQKKQRFNFYTPMYNILNNEHLSPASKNYHTFLFWKSRQEFNTK